MDNALASQIIVAFATLVASLGGYILAGINERRRDERAREREMTIRRRDLDAQLVREKRALQRETLIALQDALQKVTRLTSKTLHFDHMQARGGKYTQLPGRLSEDILEAEVTARRLVERVLDPQVRSAVNGFMNHSKRLSMSPTDLQSLSGDALDGRANVKLLELVSSYDSMADLLGQVLRREIDWTPENTDSEGKKNRR